MDVQPTHNSHKTGVANSNAHRGQASQIRVGMRWTIESGEDCVLWQ